MKKILFATWMTCLVTTVLGFRFDEYADANIAGYSIAARLLLFAFLLANIVLGSFAILAVVDGK